MKKHMISLLQTSIVIISLALIVSICIISRSGVNFAQDSHEGMNIAMPVVKAPPFLVTGNIPEKDLVRYAQGTIEWSRNLLYKDFFTKPLEKTITIYLFKDDKSYREYAWKLFGDKPSTPFGYYSSEHNALVMNIATGGGTLVHEMVHPLLKTDFPEVPTWLDEGLASLFEACREQNGHIVGMINWRLPGLLDSIKKGGFIPLKTMMSTTSTEFYNTEVSGLHYAEARYFLFYMQESGVLRTFYKKFHGRFAEDRTGMKFVSEVFDQKSIDALEKGWKAWVLTLKPER